MFETLSDPCPGHQLGAHARQCEFWTFPTPGAAFGGDLHLTQWGVE